MLSKNSKIASHLVIAGTVRTTVRKFRKMSPLKESKSRREVVTCGDIAEQKETNYYRMMREDASLAGTRESEDKGKGIADKMTQQEVCNLIR